MSIRTLSPELVPLVHHIELAKAGWGARLSEQLVVAASHSSLQPMSQADLRHTVEQQYGVRLSDGEIGRAVGSSTTRKILLEVEPGRFRLSEAHRATLAKQLDETVHLEVEVKTAFEGILAKHGIKESQAWETFKTHCLRPLVNEIGARIYHVLSGDPPPAAQQKHIDAYTDKYAPEQRGSLASAVDEFIRSGPAPVRRYILQHLHAHLLISAASLPAPTLDRLQARLKSTTHLTLIVDTNVLFSLLDLHESPGNDPSCDLLQLASRLKGKLDINVVVLPLTLDEAKRTLLHYKQKLSRLDVTAVLGRTALRSEDQLSGITQRYLQAAGRGKVRVSADAYFEPYLEDLLAIAKGKGIGLYNENTSKLGTRQDVVDDILDQQKREERKGDRAKPYESIHHDVVVWHSVHDRRTGAQQGPLEAANWFVTLDFQLLGFDSFKHRDRASYVPVCIHPTVLVQLLQLWLPRDEKVDEAMISSLRPMLPHDFDPEAEEITLKILGSLSRYENVDDLGEDTISEILMNQALRQKLRSEKDIERQTRLVRDAIIEQVEQTKATLKRVEAEKEALNATLMEEQTKRDRLADDLRNQRALAEEQSKLAGTSASAATELQSKVKDLEDELRRTNEAREATGNELAQNRFVWWCAAALIGGLMGAAVIGYTTAPFLHFSRTRGVLGAAAIWTGAWIQLVHWQGVKSDVVQRWSVFKTFCRWRGFMWTAVGGILLGVVSNRLYDMLKTLGW
jgi:hypothetical protein